jgi:O-Antigen ligase
MSNRIKIFLIFSHLFMAALVLFKTPFEFYFGYITYLALPLLMFRYGFPRLEMIIFLPLLILGVLYCEIGLNSYGQLFKIVIGFFLSLAFFHYVVKAYDYNVTELFRLYMIGAFIISIIGIIQVVSYRVGFPPGYNFGWLFNKWGVIKAEDGIRMNSFFSEPSYYSSVMSPALFVAMYNLLNRKKMLFISLVQSIIIIVAFPLTKSGVGMIGIALAVLLLLINSGFLRYGLFVAPIAYYAFIYSYNNLPEFRDRVDGTFEIYNTGNVSTYDINGSSFVLYNHTHIATENFKANPIFGTGLGSHASAFERYSLTNLEETVDIEFNKADANSMFLRLMSETGLVGLIFFGIFLFGNWVVSFRAPDPEYWVVNNACFLIIVLQLLRQGNYFYCGFPFFLWIFYYVNQNRKAGRQFLNQSKIEEPKAVYRYQFSINEKYK